VPDSVRKAEDAPHKKGGNECTEDPESEEEGMSVLEEDLKGWGRLTISPAGCEFIEVVEGLPVVGCMEKGIEPESVEQPSSENAGSEARGDKILRTNGTIHRVSLRRGQAIREKRRNSVIGPVALKPMGEVAVDEVLEAEDVFTVHLLKPDSSVAGEGGTFKVVVDDLFLQASHALNDGCGVPTYRFNDGVREG